MIIMMLGSSYLLYYLGLLALFAMGVLVIAPCVWNEGKREFVHNEGEEFIQPHLKQRIKIEQYKVKNDGSKLQKLPHNIERFSRTRFLEQPP